MRLTHNWTFVRRTPIKKSGIGRHFDDFTKMDLRVGKILEAEKMPKTKKLMKLKKNIMKDIADGENFVKVVIMLQKL